MKVNSQYQICPKQIDLKYKIRLLSLIILATKYPFVSMHLNSFCHAADKKHTFLYTHVLECFFLFLEVMSCLIEVCLSLCKLVLQLLHFLF